jgi:hypothetical protein
MYCRDKMPNAIGYKRNHNSTAFSLFDLGFAVNFRYILSSGYVQCMYLFPELLASVPGI